MKVAVVGAGVTGLALAKRIVSEQRGEVTLFDAGPAGGLAAGFEFPGVPGTYLEKYYHHIFKSDVDVIQMINEAGLGGDLMWLHSRSGLYSKGKVWPLEGPIDLLKCKPIGSLIDRLKMGLALRVFQKTADWKQFDTITVEEFFKKRGATTGYKNLWEPLLKAKFGQHFANIPAAFLWGRIYPRSRSREKGKESLGYLRGGFARMANAVAEQLRAKGVSIHFDTKVERVERIEGDRFRLHTLQNGHQSSEEFDRLIWTGHPRHLANILEPQEQYLTEHAEKIRYIAACCMVLIMSKPLGEFYWVNNLDSDVTFGGAIEHTNLIPPSEYAGKHVLYVINYLDPSHPYMNREAHEMFHTHLPSLKKVHPNFDEKNVEQKLLFKSSVASPLYDVGFHGRMPPFTGWAKGIGILGMAQVYPIDRNMSHCIKVVRECDLDTLLAK